MSLHQYNLHRDPVDERDYRLSTVLHPVPRAKVPRKTDLRKECPEVFNQLWLGSCTAQAGCAAKIILEREPSLNLSELYLYYMERVLEGTVNEDSGACMRTICKALNKYGVCEEQYMPYIPQNFKVPPTVQAHENATAHKVMAYRSLQGISQIRECIAFKKQPVLLGMEVYPSFEQVGRGGKLLLPKADEKCLGGHAALAVGYVDSILSALFPGMGYLIVRNSWGQEWGDNGYFYMSYDFIRKGYAWDFWVIE